MSYSESTENQPTEDEHFGIAIIGISCRFPGADNIKQFWDNLSHGIESISFFDEKELLERGIHQAHIGNPRFVAACGQLKDIDLFDASFFGFTSSVAEIIDPKH